MSTLHSLLATLPPGPIPNPGDLERFLAASWHEFGGDDCGMTGDKLLGRMEEIEWQPPVLSFAIERHGGTVMGSSRAMLQEWWLDLDKKTAWCEERRFRQVRARQSGFDVRALAEQIADLILRQQEDQRLNWHSDGRVRVLVGKVLPDGSAVKQTLAGRRKRFRAVLRERLVAGGWREVGLHFYERSPTQHRQVMVKVGDFEAEVDEELAPLIKELAKAEIATLLSCQENRPGIAWIMFWSTDDLSTFLNIVAEYDPEEGSLYRRATLADEEGCWEYAFLPDDLALNETLTEEGFIDEWHEGQPCFNFNPSVRFPRSDLSLLLNKMRRHNELSIQALNKPASPSPGRKSGGAVGAVSGRGLPGTGKECQDAPEFQLEKEK